MRKVYKNIFVGDLSDCMEGVGKWAIIHACKYPCHRNAVGYGRSISPEHPNYLFIKREQNLFLNIIDPAQPLFMNPLFVESLRFSKYYYNSGKNLLYHCNQGDSRAPSLALLQLSKNINVINNSSYNAAFVEYKKLDSQYKPSLGIQIFLSHHWDEL